MKKLLIFSLLITNLFGCKAQILPIEDYINYIEAGEGIPENIIYIKDVNNLLDKYVGTWSGSHQNRNYMFKIKSYIDVRYNGALSEDMLVMYYKVEDTNGNIIEDTMHLDDSSGLVPQNEEYLIIKGRYIENDTYVLYYIGREGDCGQAGDVFISVGWDDNPNKMKLFLGPERDTVLGTCPDNVDYILPLEQITLIKQD